MPNLQVINAKNIYVFLWISPFAIILLAPFGPFWATSAFARAWLVLPAFIAQSDFVRWHARQALVLVGVQTILAVLAVIFPTSSPLIYFGLFFIWFAGNLWGHAQAARGECSLMRWFGHSPMLPLPVTTEPEPILAAESATESRNVDALVEIIRTNRNEFARRIALYELRKLGMVEEL